MIITFCTLQTKRLLGKLSLNSKQNNEKAMMINQDEQKVVKIGWA